MVKRVKLDNLEHLETKVWLDLPAFQGRLVLPGLEVMWEIRVFLEQLDQAVILDQQAHSDNKDSEVTMVLPGSLERLDLQVNQVSRASPAVLGCEDQQVSPGLQGNREILVDLDRVVLLAIQDHRVHRDNWEIQEIKVLREQMEDKEDPEFKDKPVLVVTKVLPETLDNRVQLGSLDNVDRQGYKEIQDFLDQRGQLVKLVQTE